MIQELIRKLMERRDLTTAEAASAMNEVMSGEATPAQIAAFIVALRLKGETCDEITGCATVMREKAKAVNPGSDECGLVDTCGTGGDGRSTFNISTTAALVTAGAGIKVAKHGNRAVSSRSGSADVLKQLGVNIEAPQAVVEKCLEQARVGFLYAPMLHEAMKYAIGPRREIGVRTIFNILGPLTNPARARCQVLGVYDAALVPLMAGVLRNMGSRRCLVVHGDDGLDEITITGSTHVAELRNGKIETYDIAPEEVGLKRARLSELVVHDLPEAADSIRKVLKGERGAKRDVAVLNAGAAILAADKAADLAAGVRKAEAAIDSGAAMAALEKLILISNQAASA